MKMWVAVGPVGPVVPPPEELVHSIHFALQHNLFSK
jgi:hypothetical protein